MTTTFIIEKQKVSYWIDQRIDVPATRSCDANGCFSLASEQSGKETHGDCMTGTPGTAASNPRQQGLAEGVPAESKGGRGSLEAAARRRHLEGATPVFAVMAREHRERSRMAAPPPQERANGRSTWEEHATGRPPT